MRRKTGLMIAAASALLFNLGYSVRWLALPAMVGFLAAVYALAWVPSRRWAFYLGLALGFACYAPQLHFFWGIFGPAAVTLWAILALWLAAFLLLAQMVVHRWPSWGALLLPWLWFGCEYFRSELYFLRFAWVTPGFALSHPFWQPWLAGGVYGFSLVVLTVIALWHQSGRRWRLRAAVLLPAALPFLLAAHQPRPRATGPRVAGVQFEQEVNEYRIIEWLDQLLDTYPDTDIVVLSEYAFADDVPARIRAWVDAHNCYLIAGGKDLLLKPSAGSAARAVDTAAADGAFYNTAFVIGPDGQEVFRQAKSVPIQFFDDGLPAPRQDVWDSPWGKIGIAVCYDLSYSQVIDGLVGGGAEALIIPVFDAQSWGAYQHHLHAEVTPMRAREYGVPIFRLASSGISQLVTADGQVVTTASFPGEGEMLAGQLAMGTAGQLPPDRYLMPLAVLIFGGILILWFWEALRLPVLGRR